MNAWIRHNVSFLRVSWYGGGTRTSQSLEYKSSVYNKMIVELLMHFPGSCDIFGDNCFTVFILDDNASPYWFFFSTKLRIPKLFRGRETPVHSPSFKLQCLASWLCVCCERVCEHVCVCACVCVSEVQR